jgi:hypothetical protein
MGKRGGGFKLSKGGGVSGNKLLQFGGKKIDFQAIYDWIVKMISMLFYGTKNQYRWRANGSKN